VSELAAPLRELQTMLGTGSPDAATALAAVRTALADVGAATGRSWQGTRWAGDAADAAAAFTGATVAAVDAMATRADHLGTASAAAAAAVARARERLQAIVEEFEARAATLEDELDEPGTADELIEESRRALADAQGVIDDLRVELDGHQAAVTDTAPGAMPTVPMGALPNLGGALGSGSGSGLGSGMGGAPSTGFASSSDARPDLSGRTGGEAPATADPGVFGSGVDIRLPDGSTATAPNAIAASAVRHALTQLGVPYHWGGTSPGVGLDCSGLTQWAYHEAGLDLPRLAQEQDVGAAVDQSSLRPGDLAVWDGHVAMIVGNGLMVEAGSPVKLSPIRTSNAGQGFQGFWRPTA
jgi:cell wall-associated NlpC family hydrolase